MIVLIIPSIIVKMICSINFKLCNFVRQVFWLLYVKGDPCPQPAQLQIDRAGDDGFLNETCTPQKTFDYFSGSKVSYILSLVALVLAFIGK